MELDDRKTDQQLTSNMGSVLTSPNDKTETGDSTPTSSTDASTKTKESGSVPDDPISSTSSEAPLVKVSEMSKNEDPCLSDDSDQDLLENISGEKITEDVEDLVHDLESLLEKSTDSFNISNIRSNRSSTSDKAQIEAVDSRIINDLGDYVKNKEEPATPLDEKALSQSEDASSTPTDEPDKAASQEIKISPIIPQDTKDDISSMSEEVHGTVAEPDSQQEDKYNEVIVEEPNDEEKVEEEKVSESVEITEIQSDAQCGEDITSDPVVEEPQEIKEPTEINKSSIEEAAEVQEVVSENLMKIAEIKSSEMDDNKEVDEKPNEPTIIVAESSEDAKIEQVYELVGESQNDGANTKDTLESESVVQDIDQDASKASSDSAPEECSSTEIVENNVQEINEITEVFQNEQVSNVAPSNASTLMEVDDESSSVAETSKTEVSDDQITKPELMESTELISDAGTINEEVQEVSENEVHKVLMEVEESKESVLTSSEINPVVQSIDKIECEMNEVEQNREQNVTNVNNDVVQEEEKDQEQISALEIQENVTQEALNSEDKSEELDETNIIDKESDLKAQDVTNNVGDVLQESTTVEEKTEMSTEEVGETPGDLVTENSQENIVEDKELEKEIPKEISATDKELIKIGDTKEISTHTPEEINETFLGTSENKIDASEETFKEELPQLSDISHECSNSLGASEQLVNTESNKNSETVIANDERDKQVEKETVAEESLDQEIPVYSKLETNSEYIESVESTELSKPEPSKLPANTLIDNDSEIEDFPVLQLSPPDDLVTEFPDTAKLKEEKFEEDIAVNEEVQKSSIPSETQEADVPKTVLTEELIDQKIAHGIKTILETTPPGTPLFKKEDFIKELISKIFGDDSPNDSLIKQIHDKLQEQLHQMFPLQVEELDKKEVVSESEREQIAEELIEKEEVSESDNVKVEEGLIQKETAVDPDPKDLLDKESVPESDVVPIAEDPPMEEKSQANIINTLVKDSNISHETLEHQELPDETASVAPFAGESDKSIVVQEAIRPKLIEEPCLRNQQAKSLFDTPNSSEANSPLVTESIEAPETIDSQDVKIHKHLVAHVKENDSNVLDNHTDESVFPASEVVSSQDLETQQAVESLKNICDNEPQVESSGSFMDTTDMNNSFNEIPSASNQEFDVSPDTSEVEKNSQDIDETQILTRAANAAKLRQGKLHKSEPSLEKPLSISVEETKEVKHYSPKLIIKPLKVPDEEISTTSNLELEPREPLKMTITKQSDKMHSILKIYNPNESMDQEVDSPEQTVPKLIIKTKQDQQSSPKMATRSSKAAYNSPTSSTQSRSSSPRVTAKAEAVSPFKITIKQPVKEESKQKHSPKLIIKPVVKTDDDMKEEKSPKLNIKPIRPPDEIEQVHSPKIRIKPIPKPEDVSEGPHTPRLNIKPVKRQDNEKQTEETPQKSSPKVTIKPVVKPPEADVPKNDDEEVKERIVLKINKGNLTTPSKESRKREHSEEKSEKLKKIKLKFSKEGTPHIVQQVSDESGKRSSDEFEGESPDKAKKLKADEAKESESNVATPVMRVVEQNVEVKHETVVPATSESVPADMATPKSAQVTPTPRKRGRPRKQPIEPTPEPPAETATPPSDVEALAKLAETPQPAATETGRPKRSCRGVSVCDTLGIKPRKPRGGKARGAARGQGQSRATPMKPAKETKLSKARLKLLEKSAKEALEAQGQSNVAESAVAGDSSKQEQSETVRKTDDCIGPLSEFSGNPVPSVADPVCIDLTAEDTSSNEVTSTQLTEVGRGTSTETPVTNLEEKLPHLEISGAANLDGASTSNTLPEIAMFEEETRMSAEANSRAQTPAKQVMVSTPMEVEESQSSIQSTATVESGKTPASKANKGSRLEVHHDPDQNIISADQLAEYHWNGNGPFMLQEQVAQFLGIKSFKRKYPNIQRRFVDMQERDFIRESALASEAMCDLGLTAVHSADILDIMYSDFQEKYEEYCKHQRDRQTKELINKQRALSLAATQEKNKLDITEQAISSAASWNANFNKMRKEQRKASMDLQTLTVHYPKGKIKQINKGKIGNYPVSLVPGQFTDFYQEYTPTEINNLPINTMCYDPINYNDSDESESSGSESESESSDTDSSSSESCSGDDDCKMCVKSQYHQTVKKAAATSTK
ncbi:titin isoform X2 [Aethina tumida]|uniref:titin isoform X2 n=1 Tax=Aethina tumida TaxID=116153 RepID=UPI002147B425|nr:titin isoform X2 [Aethina tumida]